MVNDTHRPCVRVLEGTRCERGAAAAVPAVQREADAVVLDGAGIPTVAVERIVAQSLTGTRVLDVNLGTGDVQS